MRSFEPRIDVLVESLKSGSYLGIGRTREQGGPEKAAKKRKLREYLDKVLVELEKSDVKKAAVGFAQRGVEVWRKAFGPVMKGFRIDA